ncbi:MAG: hypothetical protein ABI877_04515 [Gemmatimonadaceae bacterium]
MFHIASRSLGRRGSCRAAATWLSVGLLFTTLGTDRLTAQSATPTSGADVLTRMHDAYAGRWYHTLTFVQKTTIRRKDGTDTVQTWYESLRHTPQSGTRLRIDFGHPSAGNGVIYTADSSYRMRGGKLVTSAASGNEFLPLIEGVYVQPVERTVREIAPSGVDMKRVSTGTHDNRKVWIVGAASPTDSTSPQFWVDAESKVLVRMILRPDKNSPPIDVRLDKYEKAGSTVLATRIEMFIGGSPAQAEEYFDWKVDVPLDPALFDAATYSSAKHWVKTAAGG